MAMEITAMQELAKLGIGYSCGSASYGDAVSKYARFIPCPPVSCNWWSMSDWDKWMNAFDTLTDKAVRFVLFGQE